jgi:hypothetical protein
MLNNQPEYKLKVHRLMVQFENGRMQDSDFINSFMPRIYEKVNQGRELSDREMEVIDNLFEEY